MPRTLLLTELPEALPDRGVLVLQSRPGRTAPAVTLQDEFLKRLALVYDHRQAELVHEDYYDRPWQILIQDNGFLLRVGNALQKLRDAGQRGAVTVRIIIQGPDNSAWRHQEVEQHLVELLTGRGAVVSVIGVAGPTQALATLYRPAPGGEPSVVQESFELTPYLEDYGSEFKA
jgi:hypothetical protein